MNEFKIYDQMTPEEIAKRNEEAFSWGPGSLEMQDPESGEWIKIEEYRRRYGAAGHSDNDVAEPTG